MQRRQLLKEEFQLFWEYASPAWAAKFLHAWCDAAAECLLAQGQVDTATVLVDGLNVPKAGSRILEAVHETAHDVHAAGFIDMRSMKHHDALRLAPVPAYSSATIRALRGTS